jgi:hypothetical protein
LRTHVIHVSEYHGRALSRWSFRTSVITFGISKVRYNRR